MKFVALLTVSLKLLGFLVLEEFLEDSVKSSSERLERWLSVKEHRLLFLRPQVQSLDPRWQLTVCDSSFRTPNTLFSPLMAPGTRVMCSVCKQTHTYTKQRKLKF